MNLLDYLTDDDIAIFAGQSPEFKDSKSLSVYIVDRQNDVIICRLMNEEKKNILVMFTPFITHIIKFKNVKVDYQFWSGSEQYWQSYLYALFQDNYLDLIRQRNEELGQPKEFLIKEKMAIYEQSKDLYWPYVGSKNLINDYVLRKLTLGE